MGIVDQGLRREEWDVTNPAAKDNVLRVVREEADAFFALIEAPEHWEAPTASGHWQVRDIVAHIIDTTEGYLERFEIHRGSGTAEPLAPLTEMATTADRHALAFRDQPREELVSRLHDAFGRAIKMFEQLTEDEWSTFMVTHAYMGPMPAWFYPVGQIMDYGVHGWDIREGLRMEHFLSTDVADLLVPMVFAVWQATTDTSRLQGGDLDIAIRVTGRHAGTTRIKVTQEGLAFEPGSEDGAQAVIEFDPASLVLTMFGRIRAGTPYGDQDAARRFANLFFRF
jgi:uncharacterized protein (TIGR03083 family)